jgi:hypothetical protein
MNLLSLLEKLHDAAISVFEPNMVKANLNDKVRPVRFTVTVWNVPLRKLQDEKYVADIEREFRDAIKSLGLEIVSKTVGYDMKMMRFDIVLKPV